MTRTRNREIRQKAIAELEKLSLSLEAEFEITANMTISEIDGELREMGVPPEQLSSLDLSRILPPRGQEKRVGYAYVSDELLRDEPVTDEVKLLILKLRHVSRQQRYREALDLARRALLLAPDYWRALISYAGLLVLLGELDEGETIFAQIRKEFSNNPKAVAAALHGSACVKEIKCQLQPSEQELQEVSRLYEESLEFDNTRANTRACLLINFLLSGETIKSRKLFEDSLQCEGFFEAMLFELEERASRHRAKIYTVIQLFPMWFRNLLYGPEGVGTLA